MAQDDSKYTDPELREQIKEDITEGDKGGNPGQWSARKAQMVASEYKKQGGEYTKEKDETQKNLEKWGEEDWQTKEGSGTAKQDDGTEARYLPKKAWENMTEEEKKETEEAKYEGQLKGDQHVPNTEAAKEARKDAQEEQASESKEEQTSETKAEGNGKDAEPVAEQQTEEKTEEAPAAEQQEAAEEEMLEDDEEEDEDVEEEEQSEFEGSDDDERPSKSRKTNDGGVKGTRKAPARSKATAKAADKSVEQKEEPNEAGEAGSIDRLPEKGQKVSWKSGAKMAEGEVLEIIKEETMLGKRKFKASEKDPRIKVKSSTSGKEAIHKPEACYWK